MLEPIAKGSKFGTPAYYNERKTYWLAHIDEKQEYVVGDMIFCSRCQSKISVDIPNEFYTKAYCPCQENRQKAEEARRVRLEKAKKYHEHNVELIPIDCQGARFSRIIRKDERSDEYVASCVRCEKFCRNFAEVKKKGRGIWLYGPSEAGKTYLTVAMLFALQEEGVPAIFTSAERILEEIKATYRKDGNSASNVFAKYTTVDCLFVDNFRGFKGGKKGTEGWASDQFNEIIRRRYEQNRPTVITSRSSIRDLFVDGLITQDVVDKLLNKQVQIEITGNRAMHEQLGLEF